jgi:hypothetical protein
VLGLSCDVPAAGQIAAQVPNSIHLEDSFFRTLGFARAALDALIRVDEGMTVDHRNSLCGTDFDARLTPVALANIYFVHVQPSSLSVMSAIAGSMCMR